jgi:hypothetical protein
MKQNALKVLTCVVGMSYTRRVQGSQRSSACSQEGTMVGYWYQKIKIFLEVLVCQY